MLVYNWNKYLSLFIVIIEYYSEILNLFYWKNGIKFDFTSLPEANGLLSTIDGNEYLHTLSTAVFLHHKCQLSTVSDKIINNSDNFRIKSLSYSEKGAI